MVLLIGMDVQAQTYNDGPIQLQVRLQDFNLTFPETDIGFFGVVGQPDDLTYYVWARDNADVDGVNWGAGSGCLTEDYVLPLTNFNSVIYSNTYAGATVPQFVDIRVDLWEDESPDQLLGIGCQGTRCAFETGFCCGGVLFGACLGAIDDDDLHCEGDPYATLDYRQGDPCVWYDHGYLNGTCNIAANDVFHPRIETFWRYTEGDACGTAISLGNVQPGFANITHYNSNVCYTDANAFPNGGQDVFYEITVTQPTGLAINTCGAGSASTAVVLLDNSCNQIASNVAGCGSGSQISYAACTPGTYYIVVEGRNNSQGTFTLSVQEDASVIVAANAGPNVFVCEGLGVVIGGNTNPTAVGGQAPYSYQWSSPGFLNVDTIANPVAFPTATQDFYLTVTDGNSCVSLDTVTVTVQPGPAPSLGPDLTLCPGSPTTLNAGPGFSTYFWSNGTFNQQQITVTTPGQYAVVVTDFNGCQGRDTMQFAYHPTPTINLGVDTAICANGNITFDAGPGFNNYSWNNSAGTQTVTVVSPGTYSVTAVDVNGCTAEDSIDLIVNALPNVVLGADQTVCPGDPVTFNAGAGYVNYNWNSGLSINQQLTTTTPGNYTVTVTDVNGCVGQDDINLFNYNPQAPNIVGVNAICPGQSTLLDAGTGPVAAPYVSYLWSDGAVTQTNTVQFPGTYTVTVTDVNGCETTDQIVVSQSAVPSVTLPPDTTFCQGTPLLISPASVSPNVAFTWTGGASSSVLVVTSPGTYYLTVTSTGGCTATDSIVVSAAPVPAPSPLANTSICPGDSVTLDPGAGFASYNWSNSSISQSITVDQPGTYTVTVTNFAGCTATSSMTLTQTSNPSVSLGPDRTPCDGETFLLNAGNPGATYNWNTGASTQNIAVSNTGQYTVTVTDANGCVAVDTMIATYNPLPVINIGPDDTLCTGSTVTLDAGPGFVSYAWSNNDNAQTTTVNTTGNYAVTVTDANGCENSDDKEIIANTIPEVDLGPDVAFCDSGFVLLDAGEVYVDYQWSPNVSADQYAIVDQPGTYSVTVTDQFNCTSVDDINVNAQGLTPLDFLPAVFEYCEDGEGLIDAGDQWEYYEWSNGSEDQYLIVDAPASYTIIVTDSVGCRFEDAIDVEEIDVPDLDLGPNADICPDEVITLDPGAGFDSYLWSTGANTQSIDIDAAGVYIVTATFQGCVREDNVAIGDLCPGRVFIPNVFTPNGDNLNDFFEVTYVNLDELTVQVYDRWGKMMFESGNKDFRWDGTYNGNPVPEGVYYYHMTYVLSGTEGIEEQEKGSVTLIR